jgi:hypothetical protein
MILSTGKQKLIPWLSSEFEQHNTAWFLKERGNYIYFVELRVTYGKSIFSMFNSVLFLKERGNSILYVYSLKYLIYF